MKRIHLIASPRNLSTALMYSFGNREDCTVVDEPFYGRYLSVSGLDHPGKDEVLRSMPLSVEEILRKSIFCELSTPLYFIKNMGKHLIDVNLEFLFRLTNLFLVRDPKKLINSFTKVIDRPTMLDLGIEMEYIVFKYLLDAGYHPLVLDTDELIEQPEETLKVLCSTLEIPFDPNMLSWPPGGRKEDGSWAKYWYSSLHRSTGFKKQKSTRTDLSEENLETYHKLKPYYLEMKKYTI